MKKLLTGITALALVITSAFTSYALASDAGSGTAADIRITAFSITAVTEKTI